MRWGRAVASVVVDPVASLAESSSAVSSRHPPELSVAVVLGDALRRVSVLGGREGMPRSLGSVYGGAVARFLGGSLRGVISRVIDTPRVWSYSNGVAVSRDGSSLVVSDALGGSHTVHVISVADVGMPRVIGGRGAGPLQFKEPRQVSVAADGFLFVADCENRRVQVLSPDLTLHRIIGEGVLRAPAGVCASADTVVVCGGLDSVLSLFRRSDGGVVKRFGARGSGDGQTTYPCGVCFMSRDRCIAVADCGNNRVSIFTVAGAFTRHVGVGVLKRPQGVACSAHDEIVVADTDNRCVRVFSDVGDLLMSFGDGDVTGVAVHDATVFTQERKEERCLVWS